MSERPVKPCPFCGHEPLVTTRKDESLGSHDIVDWTTVQCIGCDIAMRTCEGYGDAIDAWNERDDTRAEQAEAERDEARAQFQQMRETARNASRTYQSVVDRAEQAEAERDNLRFNYGQALADADHHKQESETHHAAFIEAFDRATKAEAERDELLDGRERVTAFDLMRQGGEWLGAVRSWIQRHVRNGSSVTWGSSDVLERAFTARDIEEIGAEAAAAAMRPQPNERRLSEALKARWKAEAEVARLRALLDDVCMLRGAGRAGYERGLREAAGVCEAYYSELRSRDTRDRVHAAGVGADEEAADECSRRILALLDAPAAEVDDG